MLTKVFICRAVLDGDSSKKSENKQKIKKILSKQYIPSKKEVLGYKLKFALMKCDPYGDIYKRNEVLCEAIWDDIEKLRIEIKDDELKEKLENNEYYDNK